MNICVVIYLQNVNGGVIQKDFSSLVEWGRKINWGLICSWGSCWGGVVNCWVVRSALKKRQNKWLQID